jgi:hypothetical protein
LAKQARCPIRHPNLPKNQVRHVCPPTQRPSGDSVASNQFAHLFPACTLTRFGEGKNVKSPFRLNPLRGAARSLNSWDV